MEETTEHYVGKCQAYANIRQQIFGACYMEPKEVMEHSSWKLLQYVRKTGRLEETTSSPTLMESN